MIIEACGFHIGARRLQRWALKIIGIVISLKTKLLIVGDSLMGCFFKRPGDGDASPDALS
jgi:hypothetical protein